MRELAYSPEQVAIYADVQVRARKPIEALNSSKIIEFDRELGLWLDFCVNFVGIILVGEGSMQRNFVSAIILVAVLFSAHSGFAGPLAFYTDEAAWLQAVQGYQVGTYPHKITRT